MYDRKTWIIVIACSVLLGVNVYYNQQNQKRIAEQNPPAATAPATPGVPAGESLSVTPPPATMAERLVTL